MTRLAAISAIGLLVILTGCSKVVFESETGATHEVLQLRQPGGSITSIVSAEARQPDVSFDRTRVAFVRQVGTFRQVFVMKIGDPGTLQQVSSGSTQKAIPRWSSQGRLAFRSGSQIVVLNPDFTPFNLGSPPLAADGGLDFHDNGNSLVYERDGELYIVPLDRSVPEIRITNCSSPSMDCGFPVVSHDQSKLAYQITLMIGSGWPEAIQILNTGTWDSFHSITMGPAFGAGGNIHSYDFSRRDNKMYVSARLFDPATATYGSDLLLFEVNLDGSNKQQLPPDPQVRYPSTR